MSSLAEILEKQNSRAPDKKSAAIPAAEVVPPVGATAPTIAPFRDECKSAPDVDEAIAFLRTRPWPPCLVAIHVKPDGTKGLVEAQLFESANDSKLPAWVQARCESANIYHHINPLRAGVAKKATKTDVARLASLHCDIDPREDEPPADCKARVMTMVEAMAIKPTHIIDSGNGIQLLWDINDADQLVFDGSEAMADDAKLYNVELARKYEGDQNATDVSRVFRLPNSFNIPDKTKLAKGRVKTPTRRIGGTGLKYSLGDFDKAQPDGAKPDSQAYTGTTATADLSANPDDYKVPHPRDEVFAKLEPWALDLGTTAKHPSHEYKSRSEAVFAFVTALVRHSVPDNIIAACLLHWPIGQSVREQPNTRRALKRVIMRAKERAIDADLASMNDKHAVVKIGGKTLVMTLGRNPLFKGYLMPTYQTFGAFKELHDKYRKTIPAGDGKTKEIGIGTYWLSSKFRRQYDEGAEFRPDIDSDETPDGSFNLSRGYSVKPQAGNCSLFTAHMLDNLCSGNKDYFDYLLKWCAWVVQNPSNKTDVCVVLRSDSEGTGKGVFFKKFGSLFGPHFMQITNLDHLIGKFNPHLEQLRLIFADEAFFAGDASHRGALYGIITEDPLTIEPKFVGPYPAKNYLNIGLATNLAWAIPASSTARRFFVLDVADTHKQDLPYFKAIADQWDAGGAAAFLHTLLTTDLTGFDVRKVPKTDALVVQQARSRDGIDAFIEHVCDEGRLPFALLADPSVIITSGEKLNEGFWPWLRNEFPSLKRLNSTLMSHELRKKWGTAHYHSGYINGIRFPSLAALRAAAIAKFGTEIVWSNPDTEWQHAPRDTERQHVPREAGDELPM